MSELDRQLDLAKIIRARWGQDWHKEGRHEATYDSAHNDILDLGDTIDALRSQLATLQAATQGAMDFPDGPGWWAGETANKRRFVIHWTEFDIRDDVLTVRWAEDDHSMTYPAHSFKRDYLNAKWYKLHMPWDATPVAEGEGVQPDWSQAPDWAEWWTVDADGEQTFWVKEPQIDRYRAMWYMDASNCEILKDVEIPIGIDWRTLKQRKPQEGAQP